MSEFVRNTPLAEPAIFQDWSQRFKDRQELYPPQNDVYSFTFFGPAIINLMSDLHVGNPTTDYGRIEAEADAIVKTANSFVILVGDEIDDMFWNPGQMEAMEQTPEQIGYFRSLLQYFAENGRLLHRIQGDHDGWLTRAGYNIQDDVVNYYKASVSNGPTYFEMQTGRTKYKFHGAHQLPGHSMYNKTHPQMRSERFAGGRGADVIFSGHNHQKGHAEDYSREWPGKPHLIHYVALGPYKRGDEWLSKKGFPTQETKEMFGAAVKIKPGEKHVVYFDDILEANQVRRGKR